MILVDNNQVILSALFAQMKSTGEVDENLVRYMTLNMYRLIRSKFKKQYGDMILCHESKNSWRRDYFDQYKLNRKKQKESSSMDWDEIHAILERIRQEVKENFPYKNMRVDRCEGDDIIAVLVRRFHLDEEIVVVSSDKDFQQLQKYDGVVQYCPRKKRFLNCDNPDYFLFEHIVTGDSSDGIPNVFSDDDTFVNEDKRQSRIQRKNLDIWYHNQQDFSKTCQHGWHRNKIVIDFDEIPEYITDSINEEYDNCNKGKNDVLNYCIRHKLKNLMENLNDF